MSKYYIRVHQITDNGYVCSRSLVSGNLSQVRKLALARFELEYGENYRIEGNTIHSTDVGSQWVDIVSAYEDGVRG